MIEIYDIIEALEQVLKKNLVLHRSIKTHHRFKIYKIFEYNLYSIEPDKSKKLLLSQSYTTYSPSDDISNIWKENDKKYLSYLFKWIYNEFSI